MFWRLRIFIFSVIQVCIVLRAICKLKRSKKDEVFLFSDLVYSKSYRYDITDAFEPRADIRTKYLSNLKKKIFQDYYIRVETQSKEKMIGVDAYGISKKYYIGKLSNIPETLFLHSIAKTRGIVIFLVKNDFNEFTQNYHHSQYHVILSKINEINYEIIDMLALLLSGKEDFLMKDIEDSFNLYNRQVHFTSAEEYLGLYPIETLVEQITKHRELIIKFCNDINAIFCYSEKFEYSKKERKYIQTIDHKTPKIGFIKKTFFDKWVSHEIFYYQGITDDGLFHQYKVMGDNPMEDGYSIEHILVDQFSSY